MNFSLREPIAAIDVGSNFLRMMIGSISPQGDIHPLEDLWKPTKIGRDTFATGRISPDSIHEACNTLLGFARVMKDYGVERYRAVCTSGIREADNREYVLEQVRSRTGLNVEVINQAEERFYIYKSLRDTLPDGRQVRLEGFVLINTGMGGVEVSLYDQGNLQFTEYVKVGSLRLRQVLSELERKTLDFPSLMEEYLESKIHFIKPSISNLKVRNFVAIGSQMQAITSIAAEKGLCENQHFLTRNAINRLLEEIKNLNTEDIARDFALHRNEADIILPAMIILKHFLDVTPANRAWVPAASLRLGLLADVADEHLDTVRKADFANDILTSSWFLANKFDIDVPHADHVVKLALTIFDQTRDIHKCGEKERHYLRLASILHDVGQYINASEHALHSYNIIRSQDILGLSNEELLVIANIARYHTNEDFPRPGDENYRYLSEHHKLIVSKLAAILKLAESLDVSHRQKVQKLNVCHQKNEMLFNLESKEDTLLEEWHFKSNSSFFEEVIGFRPIIVKGRC